MENNTYICTLGQYFAAHLCCSMAIENHCSKWVGKFHVPKSVHLSLTIADRKKDERKTSQKLIKKFFEESNIKI